MNSSTLTIEGQVTIPKRLRDCLGLSPGDKVRFEYTEDGAVRIMAPRQPGPGKDRKTSRFSTLRGYGDDAGDPDSKPEKMILVDSCVVIDVLENDRKWADWSQTQLETWNARGPLLTRDRRRYAAYFPTLTQVVPEAG